MATDAIAVFLAGLLACLIVSGGALPSAPVFFGWTVCNVVAVLALFMLFGMYDVVFSTVGIIDALKLCLPVLCTAGLNLIAAALSEGRITDVGTAVVFSVFCSDLPAAPVFPSAFSSFCGIILRAAASRKSG